MKLPLLKYKTRSYLKKNKASRSTVPYPDSGSVGIIFSIEDRAKHELVKELVKKLEHDGKKVTVVAYLPEDRENYEFLFDFFSHKDVSFWGNILSESALRFANTPFDFLLCLDTVPNPYVFNIVARSKARCRIGKYWEKCEPYFELMVDATRDTRSLADTIYHYTSSLR